MIKIKRRNVLGNKLMQVRVVLTKILCSKYTVSRLGRILNLLCQKCNAIGQVAPSLSLTEQFHDRFERVSLTKMWSQLLHLKNCCRDSIAQDCWRLSLMAWFYKRGKHGSYLDVAIATFLSIWSTKNFVSETCAKLLIFLRPCVRETFLSVKVG